MTEELKPNVDLVAILEICDRGFEDLGKFLKSQLGIHYDASKHNYESAFGILESTPGSDESYPWLFDVRAEAYLAAGVFSYRDGTKAPRFKNPVDDFSLGLLKETVEMFNTGRINLANGDKQDPFYNFLHLGSYLGANGDFVTFEYCIQTLRRCCLTQFSPGLNGEYPLKASKGSFGLWVPRTFN